jgi:dTMP kinase
MEHPEHPELSPEHAQEHKVEDPSALVAKLRALRRGEAPPGEPGERADFRTRVFGSPEFFRLWAAQVAASTGDWLGFFAILALASRLGLASGQTGTSIGLVMAARIVPGLFFSAPVGALIDRMDRKQVMVITMLVRAGVVATLPWVDSVLGLVFASFVLEMASMMFQPAKDATVPNLVPADRLASANSLGLAAAYGTFPVASILFALLAKVAETLGDISFLDYLKTSQEAVAFYVQVAFYLLAAMVIARIAIPKNHASLRSEDETIDLGAVFTDIKEGWHYAFITPVVRAVNVGLAVGLIGGGMLVPLGQTFAKDVLDAGQSGYGVFIAALGVGVGAGVIGVSARQSKLHLERAFVISVFGAGIALLVGVSMWTLGLAALTVAVMGVFAGSSYVVGYTLLQENVDDELRGRVFAGTYIIVRLSVLLSMAVGPFLVDVFDGISDKIAGADQKVDLLGVEISVPGVRLTLWFAGGIMLAAAFLSARSLWEAHATMAAAAPASDHGDAHADGGGDGAGDGDGSATGGPATNGVPATNGKSHDTDDGASSADEPSGAAKT